jgi:ACS family sodium-dependent inorganic phosphate cotransporter
LLQRMELEERQQLAGGGYSSKQLQPEPCLKWRLLIRFKRFNILLLDDRYIFAILGSMGMAIIYGLKVNLSVALVAMVNHTGVAAMSADEQGGHGHHGPPQEDNSTDQGESMLDGPFLWSSKQQGAILSAYFLGYFVTQIPGGRMAELYSGKYVFLVAVLMNTIGTLLSPVLALFDYRALMAIRIFEGFGGGFTFPAMNVLIAAWSPPEERSTMASIAFSGASLGTVVSMMSSGIINTLCGWEFVFYIQGGLSLIWCVLWVICVSDTPASHQ